MNGAPAHPLEEVLGYRFANAALLERALMHTSLRQTKSDPSYERLEFLGDRVLGLLIAELLMDRFPNSTEGKLAPRLSSLVSGRMLASIARTIDLQDFVQVGQGENAAGTHRRSSVLADCMEAVIGALYRDGGLDAARGFVWGTWAPLIDEADPKVARMELQEWAQKRGLPLPVYVVVDRDGPAHTPVFTIELTVEGQSPVRATGGSKRTAEQEAATRMLEAIGETE